MIGMQTKYHVIRKKVEKRMKKRTYRLLCVFASTVLLVTGALTGCSSSGKSGVSKGDGTQQTEENGAEEKKIDVLKTFVYTSDEVVQQEIALYKVTRSRSVERLVRHRF